MPTRPGLLECIERYFAAAPLPDARIETAGALDVPIGEPSWPYPARPRSGAGPVTADDVRAAMALQEGAGLPAAVEWVPELFPQTAAAARSAGLTVEELPLLVAVDPVELLLPAGVDLYVVGADGAGVHRPVPAATPPGRVTRTNAVRVPDGTMDAVTSETRSSVSPYAVFDRASWRALAAGSRLPLDEAELRDLATLGDRIDLDEVATVYLPLAELLDLHVTASRRLWAAQAEFLGNSTAKVPFVIAVAGSVAVGKSTTARLLQTLLSAAPGSPRVDLVTTDGFLMPNAVLESRGLLGRKGFPESYDRRALLRFLADVKSGREEVFAPVYDHQSYDIVPGRFQTVDRPDILVVEGLNVLQAGRRSDGSAPEVFLSDFFDFSVYVDAAETDIQQWYVDRFLALRRTAFQDTTAFFHRFASLTDEQARETALGIWAAVNGPNLRDNIAPTRSRARLVLQKANDHSVRRVLLRKL